MRTTHTLRTRSTHSGLLAAPSLLRATTRIASPAPKRLTLSLLAAALLAFLLAASASAAPPPQLWQSCPAGSAAGQCGFPRGVAANPNNGHIFVADQGNARIAEFDPLGTFVKAWGTDVVASGPDNAGSGFEICVPEAGDICKAGTPGTGAGQFAEASPQGIALDSVGDVYVLDRGFPSNQRVQKFSPSGQFLLMFGGGVDQGPLHPGDICTAQNIAEGDTCVAGSSGAANGQFGALAVVGSYIAIDTAATATTADDRVYVGDSERIQRFDTTGAYQSQIALPGAIVNSLAVDPSGNLYAASCTAGSCSGGAASDPDVRKLSPAGVDLGTITVANPKALATDSAGDLYALDGAANPTIREFSPAGAPLESFTDGIDASTGLAANLCAGSEAPGNLFLTNASETNAFLRAYGTPPDGCFRARTLPANPVGETTATLRGTVNPSGSLTSECRFEWGTTTAYGQSTDCAETPAQIGEGSTPVPVHADLSLQKGTTYHFRLLARIGGEIERGPDQSFKTLGPPLVSAEHVESVTTTEASLKALVNPEGLATTYRFDYTTQAEFEAHGFTGAQSTAQLPAGSDRTGHPATANLTGLAPGTAYRWRLVATNSSGETESAAAHTFITYRPFAPETDCPNQALRTAASAFLPDCRAYEMVSPVDKNGGDIVSGTNFSDPYGIVQASPDGDRLAYGVAYAAFAGQPASLAANQYLAERTAAGWSSEGIHPPVSGRACCVGLTLGLGREFSAFSADLCSAWLYDPQGPPLLPDAQQGYPNLYRRQNCGPGAGSLEALAPAPPALPGVTKPGYAAVFAVKGFSADTLHVIFAVYARLNDEASELSNFQIYDRFEKQNHLVSILPGGTPDPAKACVGSSGEGSYVGNYLDRAVSRDGSRVYWTSGCSGPDGIGKIYIRTHPEQGIAADECSEPAKACTRQVSAGPNAFYWAAAADGSRALYSEGSIDSGEANLIEFDLAKSEAEEPPRRLIAHHLRGVSGTSQDLSRIYFVSTDALNGELQGEEAGKPNLYLAEGPTLIYIATLAEDDMLIPVPGARNAAYDVAAIQPYTLSTRVTPDGSRIAFESRAPLTDYDNTDPVTGKPAVEVFTYEAGGALTCVSCNPSGARPSGVRELRFPYSAAFETQEPTKVLAAAWIPTWEHPLHASNVLSAGGKRLFFNSNDALLPRDTNGAQDVYEWEAPGAGRCTADSGSYFATNGGCLYLISSGQSPEESEFWEADPDGSDVFFTTSSSLLPQDPGSIDLYDARIDGGFPQPTVPAACEGEACQSPPAPPNDPTPGSSSFEGAGNVVEPSAKKCPKGRRQVRKGGKTRCVKRRRSTAGGRKGR